MFSPMLVDLLVCPFGGLLQKSAMDLNEIDMKPALVEVYALRVHF